MLYNTITHRERMNLRQIRKRKGISLRMLAKLSGVGFVTISRLETGQLDPRLSTLTKLCKALKISLTKLVGH